MLLHIYLVDGTNASQVSHRQVQTNAGHDLLDRSSNGSRSVLQCYFIGFICYPSYSQPQMKVVHVAH